MVVGSKGANGLRGNLGKDWESLLAGNGQYDTEEKMAMGKFLSWVLVMVVLMSAVVPVMAAEAKVAVMDLNMVITESEAGKAASAQLEALIRERQAAVDEKAEAIRELQEEVAEAALTNKRTSGQRELDQLIPEYETLVAQSEAEIQAKADEMRSQILVEIGEVLRVIGEQENYSLIVDTSIVHYYTQAIDITWEVIRRYNELKS